MSPATTPNPTAAALLGLLADCGPVTGAELLRLAEQRIGGYWNITRSQVYRELAALAEAGHVAAGATGPRESRPYRVTPAGRRAFRAWLTSAEPRESVRIGLLLVLAFGSHLPPGRLADILDEHERRHRERLAGYEALDAELAELDADPHVRATLSFGLHYERAVLAWLADLPDEVRGHPGDAAS